MNELWLAAAIIVYENGEYFMKPIGVVTDSHSGISPEEAEQLGVKVLPMPFYVDNRCCYEGVTFTREEFLEKLKNGAKVSTSQPSPLEVMKFWDEALTEFEQIIYIPISSGLSGSCSTASMFASDEKYENKVFVVDNGRVSAPLRRSVLDALELIEKGYVAPWIKKMLESSRSDMVIYVGVETLENLKRGGRISAASAALGTVLNIKPVLKFDVSTLDVYQKCRGFNKARKVMIEAMKNDLNTKFEKWYKAGKVNLLAASSASPEVTKEWEAQIREEFPGMDVRCDDLSMGVACHIGYGGLGIGCSCCPDAALD